MLAGKMSQTRIRIGAAALVMVVAVSLVSQRACDRAGYWPHEEETRVYVSGAWGADELRKCSALPREDGTIYFLGCADSMELSDEVPLTKVTYWGRTQREDRFQALHSVSLDGWHWNCKKKGDSLTCYAIN